MNIMLCIFKRTEDSKWERGLLINEDNLILDANGLPVKAPIYNYEQQPHYLSLTINMREPIIRSGKEAK